MICDKNLLMWQKNTPKYTKHLQCAPRGYPKKERMQKTSLFLC